MHRTEGKMRWISQRNIPLMGRESERWRRWCWLWWLLPSNAIHLSDCWGLERPDLLHFIYSCHVYLLLGRKKKKERTTVTAHFPRWSYAGFEHVTWIEPGWIKAKKRLFYPTKVIIASIEIENRNASLSQYCICQTCIWSVHSFIHFSHLLIH